MLQQYLPFTVLKLNMTFLAIFSVWQLQQYLPFTVLKLYFIYRILKWYYVATVPTVYGIETVDAWATNSENEKVATVPTVYGIETCKALTSKDVVGLQQYLPFTVCAEGCETAEERSDDEVRTSQVPERSEGKTRVIRDSAYRLRYWNFRHINFKF